MTNGSPARSSFLDSRHAPWVAAAVVFLLLCAAGFSYLKALQQENDAMDRIALESTVARQIESLGGLLARAQAPLYTLSDIVAVRKGDFPDFERYAAHMISRSDSVAGLFLAPGGVVGTAYPLAGNEAAIGHDLLADPARRVEVEEAIRTGGTVLAGPVNMRQGGVGLFARKPVFLEKDGERTFWGLVVALIKWDTVKKGIEEQAGRTGCAFELRRKLGSDQDTVLIARSADDVFPRRSVTRGLAVPGGEWIMTMSARQGSTGPFHLAGPAVVLATALAASALVFMVLSSRRLVASQAGDLLTANRELEQRLAERNLLIKEVHHRVKNNLQVIVSLLDLQSQGTTNSEFRALVAACRGRVRAIALAHEQLYTGGNLGAIDVRAYVEGVLTNVLAGFQGDSTHVRYQVEASGGTVPLAKAVPMGLIVTELVTNSLKHAFDGVDRPEIRVTLEPAADGLTRMTVRDNGRGFPESRCPAGNALGLVLVESLASQLGGGMRCRNEGGAVVELEFPV